MVVNMMMCACMKTVSLLFPGCWEAWPNIGWLSFTAAIIKQANGGQHMMCACMKTVSLLSPDCWEVWPNIGWLSFTAAIIKQANGGQH